MFSLDILFQILIVTLITFLSGWYINQLPSINKPIPGKSACLILLGIGIVFSTALLGYSLPENPTQDHLRTSELVNTWKNPAISITVVTFLYLVTASAVIPNQAKESQSKSQGTIASDVSQEWRKKLLNVVKADIAERFADTLHEEKPIKLIADQQPDQVGRLPKIFRQVRGETEIGLSIIEIFNQDDINGRLLILGEPGAGKTTSLLELASGLVQNAINDRTQPFPFIFELSNWKNDQQTIAEWIQDYLKDSNNVPADVTQTWLETGLLLPLFDGLDELGLARQKLCISRLNDFLVKRKAFPAVVCCRKEEYSAGEVLLDRLRGAIYLQPLNDQQIQTYLKKINCFHLWQGVANDRDGLLELARIPLFLNIIAVAYPEGISKTQFVNSNIKESDHLKKIRHDLFANYVNRKLIETNPINNRKSSIKSKYSPAQTKHYLKWLAQRLRKRRETEFLLEKMQPDLLSSKETLYPNIVVLIGGLTFGIIVGIIAGIIVGIIAGIITGITMGIIVGIIAGIIAGMIFAITTTMIGVDYIKPLEAIKFSPKEVTTNVILGLMFGAIFGLIFWLMMWGIYMNNEYMNNESLIQFIIWGGIFGLMWGLIEELYSGEIKTRTQPNQGIIESAKNVFFITIICSPLCVILLVFPQLVAGQFWRREYALVGSLLLSFFFGFTFAGIPVIQHYVLRFFLWRERSIPFFYADFLNYAHEKKLLKRVGGRYRFFHDLLREYFAEM